MKRRYRVEFTDEAKADISRSFEWGRRTWGEERAVQWYRSLRDAARNLLSHFPLSQPIAPESADTGTEIRHMVFGRYRLLFAVQGRVVRVLHLRGAFFEEDSENSGLKE